MHAFPESIYPKSAPAPIAEARSTRRPAAWRSPTLRPRPGRAERSRKEPPERERALELVRKYSPLVRQIAGGFQKKLPRNVLREDLIAAGMGGLWDAIRRHGETAGESFGWYVRVRIRGAILDELRAQDWLPRRARAAAAEAQASGQNVRPPAVVRLEDVRDWEQMHALAAEDCNSGEFAVEAKMKSSSLATAVDQLPERERHIVASHYFQGVKFKDLGVELGVSEPRISQLHSRAMQRLRVLMQAAA